MTAVLVAHRAPTDLLDERVVKVGGTRRSSKSTYDFPGMAGDGEWRRSQAHKATLFYGCSLCGTKFTGPHAVYVHLAKRHGR
jgi:hypothetical protein